MAARRPMTSALSALPSAPLTKSLSSLKSSKAVRSGMPAGQQTRSRWVYREGAPCPRTRKADWPGRAASSPTARVAIARIPGGGPARVIAGQALLRPGAVSHTAHVRDNG
eukprot:scaffold4219_cov618-Prasinococcus_capsulatus_cf.AAC.1